MRSRQHFVLTSAIHIPDGHDSVKHSLVNGSVGAESDHPECVVLVFPRPKIDLVHSLTGSEVPELDLPRARLARDS